MTAPYFWIAKILICLFIGGAGAIFLSMDQEEVGFKGVAATLIYALFGLGLLFRDGFAYRQWARKSFHGVNEIIRYFGLVLAGIAAVAAGAWLGWAFVTGAINS